MRKALILVLLVLVLLVAGTSVAYAQSATSLSSSSDTHIREVSPENSYGNAPSINIDGNEPQGGGKDVYGLLKFDPSQIPSDATIQTATLKLKVTDAGPGNAYEVYDLKKAWTGGSATWNRYNGTNNWEIPGAKGPSDRGSSVLGTIQADSTGLLSFPLNSSGVAKVQAWVNGTSTNNGFIIADTINSDGVDFDSRQGTTPPVLEVTYTTPSSGGGSSTSRCPVATPTGYVTAESIGIRTSNTGQQNRNALLALAGTSKAVHFCGGNYPVNNDDSFIIRSFGGKMKFDNASRFLFANNGVRGIQFEGGSGAQFYGLRTEYRMLPPYRVNSKENILFEGTTNTYVEDPYVYGSPAAGILFSHAIDPRVVRATIKNTRADGLHFAQTRNGFVDGLTTQNTGDDGLAFLNYGTDPIDYAGGTARNVNITDADARGVAIVGQRNVNVDGVTINGTSSNCVYIAYETSYSTRVPRDNTVSNVNGSRCGKAFTGKGNRMGVNVESPDGTTTLNNVVINDAFDRGISGNLRSTATLVVNGGSVANTGGSGVNLNGGGGAIMRFSNHTTQNTPSYGYYFTGGRVQGPSGTYIRAKNSNQSLNHAIKFENNISVATNRLYIYDDRATPLGYKIVAYGTQSGSMGTIFDEVLNGNVVVENQSRLSYTRG